MKETSRRQVNNRALKPRVKITKLSAAPKLIGGEDELIPFSWRHPIGEPDDNRKMNKVYKEVVALEKALTFHEE